MPRPHVLRAFGRATTALALLLAAGRPAAAAVIAVDSLADPSEAGRCTLRAAVEAANTNAAVAGCVAGSGADSIVLLVTGTIRLTAGVLTATESLSIEGPGARDLTVSGEGVSGVFSFEDGLTANSYAISGVTIANGYADYGGGVLFLFAGDDDLTLDRVTFRDCVARSDGGAVFAQSGGVLVMRRCTVTSRKRGSAGGGVSAAALPVEITNCTFAGTGSQAALSVLPGNRIADVLVTSSTIAGDDPAGVLAQGTSTATRTRLLASVLAGHAANVVALGAATVESLGYNVSDDASGALSAPTDLRSADPRLGSLQENGGELPTIALLPGSAALDRIPPEACPVAIDQRGVARPLDGDRVAGAACDSGAFEAPPPIVVTGLEDAGTASGCTLRAAVEAANTHAKAGGCRAGADGFDAIAFDVRGTIALAEGSLVVSESLAIAGPGAENLTLRGSAARVLDFVDGALANGYALYDVTIAGGSADAGAGVRFDSAFDDTLVIERCAFRENLASSGGAALEAFGAGGLTVRETLFAEAPGQSTPTVLVGNTEARFLASTIRSGPASGAAFRAGTRFPVGALDLAILGCTIAGSAAEGLSVFSAQGAEPGAVDVRLGQSVVAGHGTNVTTTQQIALQSLGYNVIADATGPPPAAGDLRGVDVKLGPLAANGGPTETQALLAGSPAVDIVPPAACATARDQRGVRRPVDGNADGKPACDAGAFEAPGAATPETLALAPATETCATGAACAVTATVLDAGAPVAGRAVSFAVSGANPRTGSVTTGVNGEARFTYTGTSAGEDAVRARSLDVNGGLHEALAAKTWFDGCHGDAGVLCLTGDRFRLEGTYRLESGKSGTLGFARLTADSGLFVYDNPTDVQAVVKVLNVCFPPFERFWVFIGALTDQEVHLSITDTRTGAVKRYDNALKAVFAPVQDTEGFATCP